jgi:nicotinate-nucleotide pyrophosphorylase (carboxylating)
MEAESLDLIVKLALAEDLSVDYEKHYPGLLRGAHIDLEDVTSDAIFTDETGIAEVVTKSGGVLSGSKAFLRVYELLDPELEVEPVKKDGKAFGKGDTVFRLRGRMKTILAGERTALNFIGHLSAIATEVRGLCSILERTKIRILDTRKTHPGLRRLEKEAVVHGGGQNHRMGLFDMVLIKDNHIDRCGSITEAVSRVRDEYRDRYKIEVEARTLADVEEAAGSGIDRIMLDNMRPKAVKKAVRLVGGRTQVEVSGNMTRRKIQRLKRFGVDYVSVGYITHSAGHCDFSLRMLHSRG